jgi:MFS family permease
LSEVKSDVTGVMRELARVTALCSVGSYLEYFDLYIAAYAAASAWPTVFYSGLPANVAFALSILSFGVIYFGRPVGAWIFGYIGDKVGRRTATMWTLIVMGVAAGGIGLLPSIAAIGVAAPVLLNILRISQGIGLGGEAGAGSTWVIEAAAAAKSKHRGFWASWIQFGSPFGNLTSAAITSFLMGFGSASFLSFNWRIPFLIGAVVAVIGAFARFKLMESPLFMNLRKEGKLVKNPPAAVIRERWKRILPITASWLPSMGNAIIVVAPFTIMLMVAMHIDPAFAASTGVYFAGGSCVANVLAGVLCDRVGRKPIAVGAALSITILCYPYFLAVIPAAAAGNTPLIVLIMFLMGLTAWWNGVAPAVMAESFETRYRISGASLSFQFASLTIGLFYAFIVSPIVASGPPTQVWPLIAVVNIVQGMVGVVGGVLLKETKDVKL